MLSQAVMGLDPGVSGGVAVLRADGSIAAVRGFKPGMTEDETIEVLRGMTALLVELRGEWCYFEKVGYIGRRKDGRKGDGGKGAFTFGNVNGFLRGSLKMAGVKIRRVTPQMWQIKMECLTGGQKNISKNKAIELFPDQKMTHAIADALLIAEYGRRRLHL